MFALLKIAERLLLSTECWVIALVIAGAILVRRRPRVAVWLMGIAAALLFLLSTRPLSMAMVRTLEHRNPPLDPARITAPVDAIVVLGGDARWEPVTGAPTILGTPTLPRLIRGIELLRKGVAPKLVLAGGSGDPWSRGPAESIAMRDQAIALGVAEDALLLDDKSRTTEENAERTRALLPPDAKRIVLVTSAMHMPRSVRLFTKQGFDVTAAPADYVAGEESLAVVDLLPRASYLQRSDEVVHEWVGMMFGR